MSKSLPVLIVFAAVALSGCGTIRMRYTATIPVSGQPEKAVVEKSYPVEGAFKPLCYISGIFFGGSCWFYLVMPTVDQKTLFKADAESLLKEKLGVDKIEPSNISIVRSSWDDGETSVSVSQRKN